MSINLNGNISDLYLGSAKIGEAYLGSVKVYSSTPSVPTYDSFRLKMTVGPTGTDTSKFGEILADGEYGPNGATSYQMDYTVFSSNGTILRQGSMENKTDGFIDDSLSREQWIIFNLWMTNCPAPGIISFKWSNMNWTSDPFYITAELIGTKNNIDTTIASQVFNSTGTGYQTVIDTCTINV